MKVDIKLVAEKSGVSISTVSRVLNNESIVHSDTVKKVKKAIADLGYRRNNIASNLRSKKSGFIGLIIPTVTYEFFSHLSKEIESHLQKNAYSLFLCNTNEDAEKEAFYINSLLDNQVDGLIIVSADLKKTSPILQNINIPIILIDRFDDAIQKRDNLVCIESDHFGGGKIAGETFLKKGGKKFAFLRTEKITQPQEQREDGFFSVMHKYHINPENFKTFQTLPEPSEVIRNIQTIYEDYKFDCLFCGNDRIAFGAINAFHKNQISIPSEVQIIGFDNIELSQYMIPAISTIAQNTEKLGELAGMKILEMVIKGKVINEHILVPTKYIERETTKHI